MIASARNETVCVHTRVGCPIARRRSYQSANRHSSIPVAGFQQLLDFKEVTVLGHGPVDNAGPCSIPLRELGFTTETQRHEDLAGM